MINGLLNYLFVEKLIQDRTVYSFFDVAYMIISV